ncbi:MAG TPA: hypothetical protein VGB42_07825 [Candidatus Thermoplasmatota archaeon]
MPTKTRLDPDAGGTSPSAEPEGAPGFGPGDNTASAPAASGAGDVSGFIDALTALSAHLRERELIEGGAKRSWGVLMLAALFLLGLQSVGDFLLLQTVPQHLQPEGTLSPLPFAALTGSAAATGALAAALLGRLLVRPIRLVQDSADRVALRHEDSPLRDRIRIAQWVLFDTAFTRFCLAERGLQGRVALGVLSVAAAGTLSVWLLVAAYGAAAGQGNTLAQVGAAYSSGQMGVLASFLALSLVSVLLTRSRALKELEDARHLARQVLTFDRDFGGFLPPIERTRVQAIVNARSRRPRPAPEPA